MPRTATRKNPEFLAAVADDVSPALDSVDFANILDQLVSWAERQKPPRERRTNASRTTISYAIPDNDVLVWRVAPRMKDGAKVELLPRDSALLPVRARQAMVKLLSVLSPGADLEPDRRLMIPLHHLGEPKVMKQFLSLLDVATKAARKLKRAA